MVDFSKILKAQQLCDRQEICDLLAQTYALVSSEDVSINYICNRELVTVCVGSAQRNISVTDDSDIGFSKML